MPSTEAGIGRGAIGVGAVIGLALACTRTAPTVEPVVATPERPAVSTQAEPEAEATEPRPPPRVSYDEGFAPPPGLTDTPGPLEIDWSILVVPDGVPGSLRGPPASPWSTQAELGAPAPPELLDPPPCRVERYLSHDLRPLRTVALQHDARGRVTRERIDDDTDGTIDLERRYAWGADGRLESLQEEHGPQPTCDGKVPGWAFRSDHVYDRHGTWLGAELRYDGELSEQGEWRSTQYDAAGRPLLWVSHRFGEVLAAELRQWDERGRPRAQTRYEGARPVVAERWLYPSEAEAYYALWDGEQWVVDRIALDGEGRPVTVQRDRDGDGRVDRHTRFEHDDQGHELARRTDADHDGVAEIEVLTRWDEAGRRVEVVRTSLEGTEREAWRYDEAGHLLRWSSKRDEHWAEDFEEHVYDDRGREIERRSERYQTVTSVSDLSGYVSREHWRGERDEQGRLLRATVLEGELGPNERIEYVYDCRKPYRRHPRRNPLDHPETAAECFQVFE
ncbi:MAG: hypothetical protein KC501_32730 [Myxococcales bacterium]|nr:hypothetical protein [Myxococcales bacterium]